MIHELHTERHFRLIGLPVRVTESGHFNHSSITLPSTVSSSHLFLLQGIVSKHSSVTQVWGKYLEIVGYFQD